MKVIETLWFTNRDGCIGIVVIEEDVSTRPLSLCGDRKAYIGPASGTDEKADTEAIIAWGNKFSLDAVQRIEHYLTKGAGIPLSVASDLLAACKEQHKAIDQLFAWLIQLDPTFFPSKSGQPWEATVKGKKAIDKAEGRES